MAMEARVQRLHAEIGRLAHSSPPIEDRDSRIQELKDAVSVLRQPQFGFTSLRATLWTHAWVLGGALLVGTSVLLLRMRAETTVAQVATAATILIAAVIAAGFWDYLTTRYRRRRAEVLADSLVGVRKATGKATRRIESATPAASSRGLPVPLDLLAFAVAAIGLYLAANGLVLLGGATFAIPLAALAVGLARHPRMATVLPFSFASHFVACGFGFVALLLGRTRSDLFATGGVAFVVFHYVCISLREKRVRYGSISTSAFAASQPGLYWTWMTVFTALAVVTLAGFFMNVIQVTARPE
jgi:hypothetical protein